MKRSIRLTFLTLIALSAFSFNIPKKVTTVGDLTVEHKKNPMGISATIPRLSWKIFSDESGQIQTAYQLLVASSPELLSEKKADLWNSGKEESDQSILVEYAGKELGSRFTVPVDPDYEFIMFRIAELF